MPWLSYQNKKYDHWRIQAKILGKLLGQSRGDLVKVISTKGIDLDCSNLEAVWSSVKNAGSKVTIVILDFIPSKLKEYSISALSRSI